MAGIGIVIPRTGPGTGPVLPTPLHSNGVAGATHRYVPERMNLTTGATVTTVPDLIGSAPLVAVGTSTSYPLIGATGGQQYVKWPTGVANRTLRATGVDLGSTFTFATVLRASDTSFMSIVADGYDTTIRPSGAFQLNAFTSTSTAGAVTGGPDVRNKFVVIFGIASGAASRLAVSTNAYVSADAGTIAGPSTVTSVVDTVAWGSGFTPTAGSEQNVVEGNVWPFALDATQRAAHVAAMVAKWSGLGVG